jgi:hypothetical protein
MGRMSDIDILDQDRQRLVAARVRVAERLKACREDFIAWDMRGNHGRLMPAVYRAIRRAEARSAIAELEPLARILGIE